MRLSDHLRSKPRSIRQERRRLAAEKAARRRPSSVGYIRNLRRRRHLLYRPLELFGMAIQLGLPRKLAARVSGFTEAQPGVPLARNTPFLFQFLEHANAMRGIG